MSVKMRKSVIKNDDLSELFNQMTGTTAPEFDIAIPKYKDMISCMNNIQTLLTKFVKGPSPTVLKNIVGNKALDDIEKFTTYLADDINKVAIVLPPRPEIGLEPAVGANKEVVDAWMLEKIKAAIPQSLSEDPEFLTKYANIKVAGTVQQIIVSVNNIKQLLDVSLANKPGDNSTKKHDLEDKTALSANFIIKSPGVDVKIFNFSNINFKIVLIHDQVPEQMKAYILQVLRYFYEQGNKLVELITSPDINIDKFAMKFAESIDQLRKHVPRCDKAFNKLRDSVGLLKSNFGGYYKEYTASQSGSPTLILENYIRDVTMTSKTDPTLIAQFRKIISFCRQNMEENKHRMGNIDPRINGIMDMMSDNLSSLEQDQTSESATEQADQNQETEGYYDD